MKLLSLVLIFACSLNSFAQLSRNFDKELKPLYELGGGAAALNIPNYPGAASNTLRLLPFPFVVYRGDFLRSDEEGTRARFLNSELFELGMSGGFNYPIDSNANKARKGMPNTDALVGLGPGVIIRLLDGDSLNKLTIGLGVRTNFAIGNGLSIRNEGWIIEPNIRFWRRLNKDSGLSFFSSLSTSYGDKKYNQFFYQVDSEYQTNDRKKYDAKEGMVDIAFSFGSSYDFSNKLSIFAGLFQSNLTISANRDSPLVEEQINTGFALGFSWLFYESDELVK